MKKIGNALIEALGGRAIHPINVTVGGFHRAPRTDALRALVPDLEWGLQAAIDTLRWVSHFEFPDVETNYELVCIQHPYEYPMNEGRVVSSAGLDIPVEDYEKYFEEQHLKQSSALTQCRVPFKPAPGSACHATEAPRGLLYHRYRVGEDGLIAEAKIVPPTSQNQGQIEEDLRAFVPSVVGYDDAEVTRRCEQLIRNYDPCISCATHSLKIQIDRS